MSDRPVIFISYSHKDRKWLEFVQGHLQVAVSNDHFKTWDDRRIAGGAEWRTEIEAALSTCAAFILLVSVHSLTSKFILDDEVKAALEAHWKRGVPIYPIIVEGVDVQAVPWLRAMNIRPTDARPLALFPKPRRNEVMAALSAEIRGIVTAAAADAATTEGHKQIIDYGRLPETAYERLVGREEQFEQLDDAWADNRTNIISLVAEGGVGKSALVNEWLVHLREEDYRGADAILGWSFFSQGTEQHATSAEPFLNWVLETLGVEVDSPSAIIKAEQLAAFMAEKRILLILDGVEPLQHGPGLQAGQLKDQGLRAFLRRFAVVPPASRHGLVVITSRVVVRDIDRWKESGARLLKLDRLSDEAGIALLRTNGVKKGTSRDFRDAVRAFGGHALSLSLLSGLLVELYDGDVRQRDKVRELLHDTDTPGHAEARRVVAAYEEQWLNDKPQLLAIMHIVGLFDRPVSPACLRALRHPPAIAGLTDKIMNLDEAGWKHAVARLREVKLLSPPDPNLTDALDAHPLVREWFGERLKQDCEIAWRTAHGRLFDYLRRTTKENDQPSLEELAPLYQAIAHGCQAGRHQDALKRVYLNRICRYDSKQALAYYTFVRLGAVGSDLAVISWFFEQPYEVPVEALEPGDKNLVLGNAGAYLTYQGRVTEAVSALRASLAKFETAINWSNIVVTATNLSLAQLLVGDVKEAVGTTHKLINKVPKDVHPSYVEMFWCSHAFALYASGQIDESDKLFVETERRYALRDPNHSLLSSTAGFLYCELLLARAKWDLVRDRSLVVLSWEDATTALFNRGYVRLTLGRALSGRAHQFLKLVRCRSDEVQRDVQVSKEYLENALERLREAGSVDDLCRGLLARAAFRRSIGDWSGTARDLDEVLEIAEPGPMRLFLCDTALERARLAFARIEAFAPLHGMLEQDNPAKPEVPSAEEIATLKAEAEKQIKIADDYIQSCGYHRRDEELKELQEVLRGERTFASLPARV